MLLIYCDVKMQMNDLQYVYVDEHDPGDCQSVFDGFAEQYCIV